MALPAWAAEPERPPVRLAIVGLVHGHVRGFLDRLKGRTDVQLVGIVDPDASLRERYRERYALAPEILHATASAMLDAARPQAVAIFTSTYDHPEVVEACATRGVHVMMEKPLAVSTAHGRRIAEAAVRGRIQVLVNYETTWYASNRAVFDAVKEGTLGPVRKMVAHDGHRGPQEIGVQPEFLRWLTDPVLNGGGALTDFGCYGANLFTWLMGNARPISVSAVTQTFKPAVYPRVDDEATIVVAWPQAVGIIQASWNWPFDRKDLEVYGSRGQALTVRREAVRFRLEGKEEAEVPSPALAAPEDDPVRYLAAVARGETRPSGLSSLENNLIVTEILDAARESAQTGRTVKLPAPR
ncbi:MAG TPA: Gfo/Idh/MocA family oxidoreductase [Vicinamibacteria bacterium]|jgi:predicted dehydrogenase